MIQEVILNETLILVENFIEEKERGLHKVTIDFKVSSEVYHDIATLLYKGVFDVKVPEKDLTFKGKIKEYSTSINNLYEKGEVGDYHVVLLEVKQ